jgi:hypothetical protein
VLFLPYGDFGVHELHDFLAIRFLACANLVLLRVEIARFTPFGPLGRCQAGEIFHGAFDRRVPYRIAECEPVQIRASANHDRHFIGRDK